MRVVLAGLAVLTNEPLNLAQSPQRVDFTKSVTEVPGESQRLSVVLAGLAVLTDEPLNLAQSPQCVGSSAPVVEVAGKRQGLSVVLTSMAVLTNAPLNFTQSPQRQHFTAPVVEVPVDGEGLSVKVPDVGPETEVTEVDSQYRREKRWRFIKNSPFRSPEPFARQTPTWRLTQPHIPARWTPATSCTVSITALATIHQ